MSALEPCPFCGSALTVRGGVNPMARCDTPKCYMAERKIGIALDDPRQVAGWNQRATGSLDVTDAMAEAAARAAYGDANYARYQNMMRKAIAAALAAHK